MTHAVQYARMLAKQSALPTTVTDDVVLARKTANDLIQKAAQAYDFVDCHPNGKEIADCAKTAFTVAMEAKEFIESDTEMDPEAAHFAAWAVFLVWGIYIRLGWITYDGRCSGKESAALHKAYGISFKFMQWNY